MANIWEEEFKIRAYEVGTNAKLSMPSLCNYLQETAGNHAGKLGVAVDQLLKKNITWVLSRLHVQMTRYPFWREAITIKTWPAEVDRFHAIRDFELFDERSLPVGKATSSWMLLDIKERKTVPIPDYINVMHLDSPGRAIDDPFDKLPLMQRMQYEKRFHVRMNDLDVNRHVNNVTYIEWALEAVPEEIYNKGYLLNLEINFRAESNYGDLVLSQNESQQSDTNMILIHRLTREEDEKELARLRTQWQLKR